MDITLFRKISWAEFFDEEGKTPYYAHISSGETTSDMPEEYKKWKEECVTEFLSKSNWRKREHEGKYFYYDKLSGSSVWEPPKELLDFEEHLVTLSQQRYQEEGQQHLQQQQQQQQQQEDNGEKGDMAVGGRQSQEEEEDDNWFIGGASGSEDGFNSDRTPVDQSPEFYSPSPQYKPSDDEEGDEGGGYFDDDQFFGDNEPTSVTNERESGIDDSLSQDDAVEQKEEDEGAKRIKEIYLLEKKLSARDAIMEPGLYQQVSRYLHLTEKHPQEVVSSLCKGYVGYAQLTHVVCDWISQATENSSQDAPTTKEEKAMEMSQFVADELSSLIKSRFNSSLADKLMDEVDREPEWLLDMLRSKKESMWRRLIIELSDEHRNSILLNWCIRELSQMGYHREIAQVISEADYFSVCNELLVDTVLRIGSAIANGGSVGSVVSMTNNACSQDSNLNDNVSSLMRDLKRLCGSTEYMFLYSNALLSEVLTGLSPKAQRKKRSFAETVEEGMDETMNDMWAQKVRRIQQELEDHLVWHRGTSGFSSKGWKRQSLTDNEKFALQLTLENESIGVCHFSNQASDGDTVFRSRCRAIFEKSEEESENIIELFERFFHELDESKDDGGTLRLLPQVDQTLRALSSQKQEVSTDGITFEILHHPQLLRILIMHVVGRASCHPSIADPVSQSSRRAAASLLALASCSSKHGRRENSGNVSSTICCLNEKILLAGDVCSDLGSLSSNQYTTTKSSVIFDGIKESSLISNMYLSWLEAKVNETLFVIRAKQLAIYPIILQIVVAAINAYASQRQLCFRIVKNAILIVSQLSSSEDISSIGGGLDRDSHREKDLSETSLSIRKDLFDIVLHLIGKGFVDEPLEFVQENIGLFDKALIRSFFTTLLQSISPPFSPDFSRVLSQTLLLPRSRECVESNYFPLVGAKGLLKFSDSIAGSKIMDVDMEKALVALAHGSSRLAKGSVL